VCWVECYSTNSGVDDGKEREEMATYIGWVVHPNDPPSKQALAKSLCKFSSSSQRSTRAIYALALPHSLRVQLLLSCIGSKSLTDTPAVDMV
jgi:hypothetical protein